MIYFKHMTNASRDEKLTNLFSIHKHEGLLTYWLLLESIAEIMDQTDRCGLRHPIEQWSKMLKLRRDKLLKILRTMAELQLIILNCSEDVVEILCPNLLKLRNYKKQNPPIIKVKVKEKVEEEKRTASSEPSVSLSADCLSWIGITENHKKIWIKAYPAVDVELELNKMAAYMKANPTRRKKNWEKFIAAWLCRTQDAGGNFRNGKPAKQLELVKTPEEKAREHQHDLELEAKHRARVLKQIEDLPPLAFGVRREV